MIEELDFNGVLNREVLEILWREFPRQDYLIDLLAEYSLVKSGFLYNYSLNLICVRSNYISTMICLYN